MTRDEAIRAVADALHADHWGLAEPTWREMDCPCCKDAAIAVEALADLLLNDGQDVPVSDAGTMGP